jgi:hypothetical protein
MMQSTTKRSLTPILLVVNAAAMPLFAASVYLLLCRAGFMATSHLKWTTTPTAEHAAAVAFWLAGSASWPVTFAAIIQSMTHSRECGKRRRSPYPILAAIEAVAWLAIWVGFAAAFFPAVVAGI